MSYTFYIFRSFCFFIWLLPNLAQAKVSSFLQSKVSQNQYRPIIVLLHGLGNNAASFATMKQRLVQALPTATVVALTSVEGGQSIHLPIKEQAEMSFKELSDKVEGLSDRPILLVGHSQGGLRAYAFRKQYEDCLNIKGLITLATPWEGVPGARVDAAILSQHLTNSVLEDLDRFSLALGYPKTHLEEQLMLNVQANQAVCLCPGGKDLIGGSDFLCEVAKSLADEHLPILAIGGGQSDFSALLNRKGAYRFKALNSLYTFFVVGTKYPDLTRHHDMQIPLYSQHALNIIPKSNKNFKRVLIKDAFHSTHVLGISVPKHKAMLAHPRVLHRVVTFAKNTFK